VIDQTFVDVLARFEIPRQRPSVVIARWEQPREEGSGRPIYPVRLLHRRRKRSAEQGWAMQGAIIGAAEGDARSKRTAASPPSEFRRVPPQNTRALSRDVMKTLP